MVDCRRTNCSSVGPINRGVTFYIAYLTYMIRLATTTNRPVPDRQLVGPTRPPVWPSPRLESIDALRGFTMFWIVGGAQLTLAVAGCFSGRLAEALAPQAIHAGWRDFHAWDQIGPMFLFVVGTAMPFAWARRIEERGPYGRAYWRIARRVIALWVLGMIAQGSLLKYHRHELELYSNTLQAIAVGYAVTSIALLHLRVRGQLVLVATLLLSYWAWLAAVPFGGHAAGTFERDANLPLYVDQLVLGSFRRDHHFAWLLPSLGFAATVLLGSLAGQILRARLTYGVKLRFLTASGVGCMLGGWLWSCVLPINRYLWTSSLVLWCGGLDFLLLALFYFVIDVAGIKRWAFPFLVFGANALLAYMLSEVYHRTISDVLVINLARQWADPYGELLRAVAEVGLLWLVLWYLYRKGTLLRA